MATLSPAQENQPVPKAGGPYGHRIHPFLVTIPIGAWMASLVLDIVSQIGSAGSETLVDAAYWLIAAGVIGAVIAALFGFKDLFTIPRRTRALHVGIVHMMLTLCIIALFAANWWWRHVTDGYEGPKTHPNQLVLSVAGIGLLLAAGWLGVINDPVRIARLVSPSGQISIATQQIDIGQAHAGKTVAVSFRADAVDIYVPRTREEQLADLNATADEQLPGGLVDRDEDEAWQAEVQQTLYGSAAGDD
jgi:uncharacterized membrane protein